MPPLRFSKGGCLLRLLANGLEVCNFKFPPNILGFHSHNPLAEASGNQSPKLTEGQQVSILSLAGSSVAVTMSVARHKLDRKVGATFSNETRKEKVK